jgi:hypothetical protein
MRIVTIGTVYPPRVRRPKGLVLLEQQYRARGESVTYKLALTGSPGLNGTVGLVAVARLPRVPAPWFRTR